MLPVVASIVDNWFTLVDIFDVSLSVSLSLLGLSFLLLLVICIAVDKPDRYWYQLALDNASLQII